jgi:hypothetical protein
VVASGSLAPPSSELAPHAMLVLTAATFLEMLHGQSLIDDIEDTIQLFAAGCAVTVVVEGLEKHFRALEKKENNRFREQVLGKGE